MVVYVRAFDRSCRFRSFWGDESVERVQCVRAVQREFYKRVYVRSFFEEANEWRVLRNPLCIAFEYEVWTGINHSSENMLKLLFAEFR